MGDLALRLFCLERRHPQRRVCNQAVCKQPAVCSAKLECCGRAADDQRLAAAFLILGMPNKQQRIHHRAFDRSAGRTCRESNDRSKSLLLRWISTQSLMELRIEFAVASLSCYALSAQNWTLRTPEHALGVVVWAASFAAAAAVALLGCVIHDMLLIITRSSSFQLRFARKLMCF